MAQISNQVIWCQQDEVRIALIIVRHETKCTTSFSLASTVLVKTLIEYVACSHEYHNGTFTLMLESAPGTGNVSVRNIELIS